MPRVNECLAAKQIESTTPKPAPPADASTPPGKPCTFGCASFCVGPQCAGKYSEEKKCFNLKGISQSHNKEDSFKKVI